MVFFYCRCDSCFNGKWKSADYWRVMKKRLLGEGNETVTNCNALKMKATDGKMRITDVADIEQLLRLIQSIPSKKARVGSERIDETADPELGSTLYYRVKECIGHASGLLPQNHY